MVLEKSVDQSERTLVKLGAALSVAGALLALVVNPLHGDLPGDPEVAFTRIAETASWGVLHLGTIVSVVLILGGLVGLNGVAEGPLARSLARLSLAFAFPGAAVMFTGLAIDGFATKALADLWASASGADRAALFRVAIAVEQVQNALFHTWAMLFIGLPFLLLGLSSLVPGGGFPRWLGAIGLVGGAGALVMGVAGFLHIPVPGLLFNVFAGVVTIWILLAGIHAWRNADRPELMSPEFKRE